MGAFAEAARGEVRRGAERRSGDRRLEAEEPDFRLERDAIFPLNLCLHDLHERAHILRLRSPVFTMKFAWIGET